LDKFYTCKGDDPLSSVHVYLSISSIELPHFYRKKGEQFTTVTYLSVLYYYLHLISQMSIRPINKF